MNLAVLRRSRPVLQPGDVFAMLPPVGGYLFGRVIHTDTNVLGVGGAILLYIYKARSEQKQSIPELSRENLLLPPTITNKRPWTMGYFEHLEHRPLTASDRFHPHCFENSRGWYFDETGKRLEGPTDPVGCWGLGSFRTIDDDVSRVLGIPLAPD